MSPSLLMKGEVTYCNDDLEAEVSGSRRGLVGYRWVSCERSSHGWQQSRKNGHYQSQLAFAITEELVTHLMQILSAQSFAFCSHGIFDLILNDRTALAVVVNHSLTVNETPTLRTIFCALQSFYLQYMHLRLFHAKWKMKTRTSTYQKIKLNFHN